MRKVYFNKLGYELTFCILDFLRPQETAYLIQSIQQFVTDIKYEIILYTNAGYEHDYPWQLARNYNIDKLIVSAKNEGSGFATPRMVEFVQTEYFFNFQCDRFILRPFGRQEFEEMKNILDQPETGAVDLTGLSHHFSEQAYVMKTDFYTANTLHEGGGAGPYVDIGQNSETTTYNWIIQNNKQIVYWKPQLVGDSGKYAFYETASGGLFRRRCDTHQIWVLKVPKKKESILNFTDEEWEIILTGKWRGGTTPSKVINQRFYFFDDKLDPMDPE